MDSSYSSFQPLHAPVVQHARVQEVLVDRGELVLQRLIEKVQDLRITFHGRSSREIAGRDCMPESGRAGSVAEARGRAAGGLRRAKEAGGKQLSVALPSGSRRRGRASGTHLPQQVPSPVCGSAP